MATAPAPRPSPEGRGLVIDEAFARPAPGQSRRPDPPGAAFVTIENKGDKTYQLVGFSTLVAGQVEIQQAQRIGKSVRTRRMS
jgi:copper(I)-binding protein